jgi:hypothetical protein
MTLPLLKTKNTTDLFIKAQSLSSECKHADNMPIRLKRKSSVSGEKNSGIFYWIDGEYLSYTNWE